MPRHLIHIGFPKAGSTALQAWFERNPELIYAPSGLAGHSDAAHIALRATAAAGGDDDLDRWCVTSSERLATPWRRERDGDLDDPRDAPSCERRRRACDLLRGLFDDATVLIVTRGFRAVFTSGYSEYVRHGGRLGPRELTRTRLAGSGLIEAADYFNYDATAALYAGAFGVQNVVVMPYELLRDDPHAFIAALERRLGLAPSGEIPPWVNPGFSGAELYWYPRLSRVASRATGPLGARGERAFRWYRARIGGPDMRRGVELLARVAPGRSVNTSSIVPAELLEHCRGQAAGLAALPAYAPYAAEYLNDDGS